MRVRVRQVLRGKGRPIIEVGRYMRFYAKYVNTVTLTLYCSTIGGLISAALTSTRTSMLWFVIIISLSMVGSYIDACY